MRESTWYAVHVFSGHEQKIEKHIQQMMETNELISSVCFGTKVPIKVVKDTKDGKQRERKKKLMPGYILLDLDLPAFDVDEEKHKAIVHTIKSIDGVTGFVNFSTARGSKPSPISRQEMNKILEEIGEIKVERPLHDFYNFQAGDSISIIDGPFQGFSGVVEEVLLQHSRLKISIEIFGRPTVVEVGIKDAEKK